MPIEQLKSAPKAVRDLYWQHFEQMRDAGKSDADARQFALRMIHVAGWYRRGAKWEQLTPDLREKVNVREATLQPNGRYLIPDVDVFYANAVKGGDQPYTADDIDKAIKNTNDNIASGGWRPPLIEGHNPMGDVAADSQADGHGYGINWTPSPRGPGWARCHIVDLDPSYLQRMKDRKLSGLSARMAKDAGKLNLRFGHIALLGGTPPALSRLPMLEVFSSTPSSLNQVCFSADTDTFKRIPVMQKQHAKSMADRFAALNAAYTSYAAGEEGAEDKLNEAHTSHLKAISGHCADKEFASFVGESQEGKDPLSEGALPGGEYASLEGQLPEEPEHALQHNAPPPAALEFSDSNAAAAYQQLAGRVGQQAAMLSKYSKVIDALTGKLARQDHHTFCDSLRKEGHQLPPQELVDVQWEACFSAADPKKSLASFAQFLRSLPKVELQQGPADFNSGNPLFGMAGAGPERRPAGDEDFESMMAQIQDATGKSFSADDMRLGAVCAKVYGGK